MEIDHSLDGQSRFAEICSILSVGCGLTTLVVGLRAYTRLVILRTFGWDDGVMALAQLLAIGSAVAIGFESKYGLGSHTWVQPEDHLIPYMKAFYSSIVVYNVAMCLVKVSILLQYRRIFAIPIMQRLTLYGVICLTAWAITLCFLLTLVCIPVAAFWDHSISGKCLDSLTIWYLMAAFNLVTDFVIFSMPLPAVRSLQLPRRQKAMLFLVFGLGFFTCVISIIRIRTLKNAAETKDPNWDNVDAASWSFLELVIGILAACLPTLRPIFVKIMPRLFSSSISRSDGRSGYGAYYAPGSLATNTSTARHMRATLVKSESMRSLRDEDNIELALHDIKSSPPAAYSIRVTGGRKLDSSDARATKSKHTEGHAQGTGGAMGGIQTTTVVTQQVTLSGENPHGWGHNTGKEGDSTS